MSSPAPDRVVSEDPIDADGLSLSQLVERFGEAPGQELFERIDVTLRRGDRLRGKTVRAARQSLSAARIAGHAQLVMPGRSGGREGEVEIDDGIVVISMGDLEAVVKANTASFDWAEEFAPRRDLPVATTPIVARSGAPGRSSLKL